jgi:hypothetical protein
MKLRPRARPTELDAALGLLAPFMGLLTFPHRLGRPENPLHFYLGRFIPHDEWAYLPTTCMGTPYGPADAVRMELLLDLADDFFIFTIAMFGVCFLAAVLTSVRVARARHPAPLAIWTLLTAVLSVVAWCGLLRAGLVAM